MSKKIFTNKEIEILSNNKHVKNVSVKGVTYTEEFRNIFIIEHDKGKLPRIIFMGARQIKMTLEGQFGIIYNLKRIRRVMKKYSIICPIRKANPYRRMMKATREHTVLPNLLKRNFKQGIPGKILLTDITYLFYGKGQKAYLSTIKNASTNEIVAYNVSSSLKLDIVTDTIQNLKNNKSIELHKDAFIHSDQGVHYTSPKFQQVVKDAKLGQSCLDEVIVGIMLHKSPSSDILKMSHI